MNANVGIAERAERLIVVLVGTGLAGLAVPRAVRPGDRAVAARGAIDVTVVQRHGRRRPPVAARRGLMLAALARSASRRRSASRAGWAAVRTACPSRSPARAFRAGADVAGAPATARARSSCARNLRRVLGPDASELRLDALVARGAALLLRATGCETFRLPDDGPRRRARRRMPHWTAPSTSTRRSPAGRGCRRACRTWATGTSPALWFVAARAPVHHGRRAAAAASRCSTGSWPTARAWAWRSCRSPAASGRPPRCWPSGCARAARSCLLADRDLSRTGVEVELLRRAAPGCRPARRCSRPPPAPRCSRSASGSPSDGLGAAGSTRRVELPRTGGCASGSRRRPRRSPTPSPRDRRAPGGLAHAAAALAWPT